MRVASQVLTLVVCAAVAGCVQTRGNVTPVARPCTTADKERLALLTGKTGQAAASDSVGVYLFGVPVDKLSKSDKNTEIATLKGRCGS